MIRVVALASLALLLASACSSATPAAETKATTAATTAASSGTKSGATAATGASTAAAKAATTTTSAPATKAGATASDACGLITADEVGRVMGATGVKAESQPELAGATYCIYHSADGNSVAATSYLKAGATAYSAFSASSTPQAGVGDRAQWDPSSESLMVLKGQGVMVITAGDGSMPTARRIELAKQLAAIGVTRQ
ncbi:MAG: hypothetical protein U0360_04820 [Dehalococcoidia bacterium]